MYCMSSSGFTWDFWLSSRHRLGTDVLNVLLMLFLSLTCSIHKHMSLSSLTESKNRDGLLSHVRDRRPSLFCICKSLMQELCKSCICKSLIFIAEFIVDWHDARWKRRWDTDGPIASSSYRYELGKCGNLHPKRIRWMKNSSRQSEYIWKTELFFNTLQVVASRDLQPSPSTLKHSEPSPRYWRLPRLLLWLPWLLLDQSGPRLPLRRKWQELRHGSDQHQQNLQER